MNLKQKKTKKKKPEETLAFSAKFASKETEISLSEVAVKERLRR